MTSARSSKLTFNRDERLFYFVPKADKDHYRPDILGLKKIEWDPSVSIDKEKVLDYKRQLLYVSYCLLIRFGQD